MMLVKDKPLTIVPQHGWIVVRKVNQTLSSGLIVPQSASDKMDQAFEIVAMASKEPERGRDYNVGDKVIFGPHAGIVGHAMFGEEVYMGLEEMICARVEA